MRSREVLKEKKKTKTKKAILNDYKKRIVSKTSTLNCY